jgi:hypothetical protein
MTPLSPRTYHATINTNRMDARERKEFPDLSGINQVVSSASTLWMTEPGALLFEKSRWKNFSSILSL